MIRAIRLLLVAGWFLLVLNAIDGGNLADPINWVLTLGGEGAAPGILAAVGWGIASLVVLIVLPFSQTLWWRREQGRWLQVGELLLVGPPTSPRHGEDVYDPAIQRRLGAFLVCVGMLFLLTELLEMDVHAALSGKLNGTQDQSYWLVAALSGVCALGIIGFGLATPALWGKPIARLWSARLLVALCFVTLFAELYEREQIHRLLISVRDVRSYREGVASIWVTAGATLSFMCAGWVFAERGRPE